MFKIKISSYLIFREIIKGLLTSVGFWPRENPSLPYRLLSYIQLPLNFGVFLAIFNFVRLYANNLTILTESFSILGSYLSTSFKVTYFLINRREILELHRTLDTYFTKLAQDHQMKKIIFKKFGMFKFLSWSFSFGVFMTLSTLAVQPLVDMAIEYRKSGKIVKYPLIFPSKYPWPTSSNGWAYKLTYLFESLATTSLVLITAGMDSLYLFYIFQIIGQLREMGYCITHTEGYNEKSKDSVIRRAVYQYQILIRAKQIIEKIYSPIILWVMFSNAAIMCVLIFKIMQMTTISALRLTMMFAYVVAKMLQTFLYAWGGTALTVESEDFREAIYKINWYGSKKIMNSIIIMMAQKPMIVTALKFLTVDVNIFAAVLKTTMSYFFLLQTLEEK